MKASISIQEKLLSEEQESIIEQYLRQLEKVSDKKAEILVSVSQKGQEFVVGIHWQFKKNEVSYLAKNSNFAEAATEAFSQIYSELRAKRDKKLGVSDDEFLTYSDDESA